MSRVKGSSQHTFAEVPRAMIPRSSLDRSCNVKTTFDAGQLVPVFVDEVLPGDTMSLNMTAFARLATPLKPIMDNMYLESFFFFVPYRLVWTSWEKFCGEQVDPGDSIDYTVPRLASYVVAEKHIADYFGIPPGLDCDVHDVSALPFRAYGLIWNEWFRDENLQDSLTVVTSDANGAGVGTALLRRGKRHDYFTSCLPWPQKGDSVSLPLGTSAPIIADTDGRPTFQNGTATVTGGRLFATSAASSPTVSVDSPVGDWGASEFLYWDDPQLLADLSTATAATINQLRQAFQVQKLLERDARGGTRYTEVIKSHFGVTSPDARLQRPEYLGGGHSMVNINPIAQTSEETTGTPQGNLAAIGTATARGHGFHKSFTEHGVVIGLVNVRADLTYQQGLERMWSRSTRYDFYWPALAQIGEQAVLSKEIYVDNTANDEDVFGYQERFAEYRYKPSIVTAEFRSSAAATLDVWHLAQEFSSRPTLNTTFIQDNPPVDRIIAVDTEPHFLFDAYFKFRCARPMPVFGVPGFIDHF